MFPVLLAAALTTLPAPVPLPPAPLAVRVTDPAVIRVAVREALASDAPTTARNTGRVLSGDAHAGFTQAVDEARVPGCLNTDALKHQPAKLGVVSFDGLMAVPFWLTAMVRGKCQ